MTAAEQAAVRRLRPLLRRHGRGRHPPRPVREQRHRDRRRRTRRAWSARWRMSGEAAVMARYQGHVAVFRATVPLGVQTPRRASSPSRPSSTSTPRRSGRNSASCRRELCTDERVHPPRVPRHHRHAADAEAGRRRSSPTRTPTSATSWSTSCSRRRSTPTTSPTSGPTSSASSGGSEQDRATGTFAFHDWIREAIAADKPYDEFVREILARHRRRDRRTRRRSGTRSCRSPSSSSTTRRQVFLGLRLACANCHHHPYEKWSQDDYWGLAAFFGRVGRKNVPMPGRRPRTSRASVQVHVHASRPATCTNKRTGKPAADEAARRRRRWTSTADDDPRQKLVDWMTDPKNPFFAKAVANRYWAHFFGRGIVDPLDDMRVTNPPSNPELLDALAKDLVDNKYSLKHAGQDDLQEPDVSAVARCRTSSTSTTSRPSPATTRSGCRPRCCSTRSAR